MQETKNYGVLHGNTSVWNYSKICVKLLKKYSLCSRIWNNYSEICIICKIPTHKTISRPHLNLRLIYNEQFIFLLRIYDSNMINLRFDTISKTNISGTILNWFRIQGCIWNYLQKKNGAEEHFPGKKRILNRIFLKFKGVSDIFNITKPYFL